MKQVQSQKGKLRDDITQKADLSLRIKEEIVNILKDEVDEKFLAVNKHVIASIDSLMKDMKRSNTEFRIRFIPADYLVEFTNYYRQSQMALVESLLKRTEPDLPGKATGVKIYLPPLTSSI